MAIVQLCVIEIYDFTNFWMFNESFGWEQGCLSSTTFCDTFLALILNIFMIFWNFNLTLFACCEKIEKLSQEIFCKTMLPQLTCRALLSHSIGERFQIQFLNNWSIKPACQLTWKNFLFSHFVYISWAGFAISLSTHNAIRPHSSYT